jgi:hypothetical protein
MRRQLWTSLSLRKLRAKIFDGRPADHLGRYEVCTDWDYARFRIWRMARATASPTLTNVPSMKSSRQFDPGPVGRLARRGGHVLKEVRRHGAR